MRPSHALVLLGIGCTPARPEPALVIAHVTVVDVRAGTEKPDQTVVIRGRGIATVGDSATTKVPDSAEVVDGP